MIHSGFFYILLACALYGLLHSLLAAHTTKNLAMRWMGTGAYRRFYRLFFVFIAFVTTLPLLALLPGQALLPKMPDQVIYRIPAPWVYLTLLIQGLAMITLLMGVLQTGALAFLGLRQLLNPAPGTGAPEKLVVSGLYHWVRHPLYTASLLILWLAPSLTWNLLALNLGLSAYLLIGTIFEERKLVQQFGKEYEDYRQRTPRIVPRF